MHTIPRNYANFQLCLKFLPPRVFLKTTATMIIIETDTAADRPPNTTWYVNANCAKCSVNNNSKSKITLRKKDNNNIF